MAKIDKKVTGFTLLELLAILVILSALAVVTIPLFSNKRDYAKQVSHNESVAALQKQANAFVLQENITGYRDNLLPAMLKAGYIKDIPENPITEGEGSGNYKVTLDMNGKIQTTPGNTVINGSIAQGTATTGTLSTKKLYGGSVWDASNGGSILPIDNGGYIFVTDTASNNNNITDGNNGGIDFWVAKLNSDLSLNTNFNFTFGGSGTDYPRKIIKATDGGYLVVGYSNSPVSGDVTEEIIGNRDIWVLKISESGVKEWDKRYGGTGDDYVYDAIQTDDGGYIFVGDIAVNDRDITDGVSGPFEGLIFKIDSSGKKEWDKTYGGTGTDIFYSITEDGFGGYIINGYTDSSDGDISDENKGLYDILAIRVNYKGEMIWHKTYGGSANDFPGKIIKSTYGGYIICGTSQSNNGDITDGNYGLRDAILIKINDNGEKEWDKTYGGANNDNFYGIIQAIDGGYIMVGQSMSSNEDITDGNYGAEDVLIIKVDKNGKMEWNKTFGTSGSDLGWSIVKSSDIGYIVICMAIGGGGDVADTWSGQGDLWVFNVR